MSNPNISVIIPFYNSEISLEHCLNAVYKSNYKNFEVIAVSDNSKDKSDEIAKKFPCKIVKLKKNYGSGYSRNIGSKLAKGNILVFLDSDVIIKKDSLTIIQNYFKKKKNHQMIQGIYSHYPDYKKIATQYLQSYQCYYVFSSKKKFIENLVSNFFSIKKKIFSKVGGFDGKFIGSNAEDADLGYRLMQKGYKIPIFRNLKVRHLVNFNIFQFIKKITRIHTGEMKMFLRNKNIEKKIKQKNYSPVINSIVIVFFQIIFILFEFFYQNLPLLFISLILNFFLFINQFNFLNFIHSSKGFFVTLKCIPYIYLHKLLFIYSFFWGIIDFYIFRKKY